MTKLNISLLTAAALSLAVTGAALADTTPANGDSARANTLATLFASDGEISRSEAKTLIRAHFRSLGFTRPRYSQMSAQLDRLELGGDKWRAKIRYGGVVPTHVDYIVLNARTGEIDSSPLRQHVGG